MPYRTRAERFGGILVLCLIFAGMVGCGDLSVPSLAEQVSGIKIEGSIATGATVAGQAKAARSPADSLLVVFTYGNFCSAEGRGNGLRDIAEAIRKMYPNQRVITRCWNSRDGIEAILENHPGPVALIGHSWGGSRTLDLAARLRRPVDWLVLLDPVPVDITLARHDDQYFDVPPNVTRAICYYRPPGFLPISYGFLHTSRTWVNRVRTWGHNEFCESSEVQQCILKLCAWENILPLKHTATASAR